MSHLEDIICQWWENAENGELSELAAAEYAALVQRAETAEAERNELGIELSKEQENSEIWRDRAVTQRERADKLQAELNSARVALVWYLQDDRRSLEQGLIEKLSDRPAFAALQPADSAEQEPSAE